MEKNRPRFLSSAQAGAGKTQIQTQPEVEPTKKPNSQNEYGLQEIYKWLPGKDSNLDKRYQKPLCYHYTTRQLKDKKVEGWGGWSQALHGIKKSFFQKKRGRPDLPT